LFKGLDFFNNNAGRGQSTAFYNPQINEQAMKV